MIPIRAHLIILTLSLVAAHVTPSNIILGTRHDYPVCSAPNSISVSDLNLDGIADLVLTNNSDSILVMIKISTWDFGVPVYYDLGQNGSYSPFSTDLNSDGYPDLVIANSNSYSVSVLLNSGDGSFANQRDYSVVGVPVFIRGADIDLDGDQDIVISAWGEPNAVTVLKNSGDGSFFDAVDYPVEGGPSSLVLADFDADGMPDVAVSFFTVNQIQILRNDGSGTFNTFFLVTIPGISFSINSADFDGNGAADIVVANFVDDAPWLGYATMFLNSGHGVFSGPLNYQVGIAPGCVTSADFDGDGRPDLAVTNEASNTVSLLRNRGDGTLSQALDYGTELMPYFVAPIELNGDGRLDLVVANYASNSISFFGNGTPRCCLGLTGNVDCDGINGTDISDLAALIDNLYISFVPLCCTRTANTDGSLDGRVDISDLTALIDYLYISFTPPAACQ